MMEMSTPSLMLECRDTYGDVFQDEYSTHRLDTV